MERLRAVAFLLLFASSAVGAELTQRQRQIIGQLITPKAGGFTVQVIGGTAEPPFLDVSGTLPSAPSGAVRGLLLNITGAGSTSQEQRALGVNLLAGYTGSSDTQGAYVQNFSLGTGVNYGMKVDATPASQGGTQVGLWARGAVPANNGRAIGLAGQCNSGAATGVTCIAVHANANSGSRRIAGFFSKNTSFSPTISGSDSPSLIVDEGGISGPSFAWQDGSSRLGEISQGGHISMGSAQWIREPAGRKVLSSDFTDSTATLTNTSLSATVIAGRTYAIRVVLYLADSTAAEGSKIDFDGGTATATNFRMHCTQFDTALLLSAQSSALATDFAQATVTGDSLLECYGQLVVNAAGTFIVRAAQNTHALGTLTVYRGSHLILTDLGS